jgi:hypothetical protein
VLTVSVAGTTTTTTTSEDHSGSTSTTESGSSSQTTDDSNDGHGDAVHQGVMDCKAARATSGKHGIGHCVSPIAHKDDHGSRSGH